MNNFSVSAAMAAKSDQLNAVDIMAGPMEITVQFVDVLTGDQPVVVHWAGGDGRPWKPSKGMVRILAACWGENALGWIGKKALLAFDPTVTWAGQAVGGIRIKALSDIPEQGVKMAEQLSRNKRTSRFVEHLPRHSEPLPEPWFSEQVPAMAEAIKMGQSQLGQLVAGLHREGREPSSEQLAMLMAALSS